VVPVGDYQTTRTFRLFGFTHHNLLTVAIRALETFKMASTSPETPAATFGFAVYGNAAAHLGAGINTSTAYPTPQNPQHLDEVYGRIRHNGYSHADPEKKALFSACTNVIHLTRHIGTELHGIQLSQLTDQQKDELGLLIAERSVVFFRDQDISSHSLLLLEEWYRETEGYPQVAQVPGVPGVTAVGPDFQIQEGRRANFRQPSGASLQHSDLVYSFQPLSVTHHDDAISGYGQDLASCFTNDQLRFKWTPGTSALWDNRVLRWMTRY